MNDYCGCGRMNAFRKDENFSGKPYCDYCLIKERKGLTDEQMKNEYHKFDYLYKQIDHVARPGKEIKK